MRTPERGWTERTEAWKNVPKEKNYCARKLEARVPLAAQTQRLGKKKKHTKHITTPQISMLLLDPVFAGSILSMTNVNAIKPR